MGENIKECRESNIDFNRYIIQKDGEIISKFKKSPLTNKNNGYNDYILNTYRNKDGKQETYSRHRVIWYYFNGNIPEGYQVDHIVPLRDGGTNALSNLRLVTPKENMNNPMTLDYMKNNVWNNDERNNKISQNNKGRTISEEQKKRQSLAMSGEKHPLYGKKRPEQSAKAKKRNRDNLGRWI